VLSKGKFEREEAQGYFDTSGARNSISRVADKCADLSIKLAFRNESRLGGRAEGRGGKEKARAIKTANYAAQ
jgi:hypothetical protein